MPLALPVLFLDFVIVEVSAIPKRGASSLLKKSDFGSLGATAGLSSSVFPGVPYSALLGKPAVAPFFNRLPAPDMTPHARADGATQRQPTQHTGGA